MLAIATFGMFGNQNAAALAIVGWVPVTLLTGYLMSRRRGFTGPDPRSALGLACVATAQADLSGNAGQAHRVALGGFAAMTDPRLRLAVQGGKADSVWQVPRRRPETSGIDLLAFDLVRPAAD